MLAQLRNEDPNLVHSSQSHNKSIRSKNTSSSQSLHIDKSPCNSKQQIDKGTNQIKSKFTNTSFQKASALPIYKWQIEQRRISSFSPLCCLRCTKDLAMHARDQGKVRPRELIVPCISTTSYLTSSSGLIHTTQIRI